MKNRYRILLLTLLLSVVQPAVARDAGRDVLPISTGATHDSHSVVSNHVSVEANTGGNSAGNGGVSEGNASASVSIVNTIGGTTTPTSAVEVYVSNDGGTASVTREQVIEEQNGAVVVHNSVSVEAGSSTSSSTITVSGTPALPSYPPGSEATEASRVGKEGIPSSVDAAKLPTTSASAAAALNENVPSIFESWWRALIGLLIQLKSLFSLSK